MIYINLDKAKLIAHSIRRHMRNQEFEPLDEKFVKQIPGIDLKEIEAQRQSVRDKYADMQLKIDASKDLDSIKSCMGI